MRTTITPINFRRTVFLDKVSKLPPSTPLIFVANTGNSFYFEFGIITAWHHFTPVVGTSLKAIVDLAQLIETSVETPIRELSQMYGASTVKAFTLERT